MDSKITIVIAGIGGVGGYLGGRLAAAYSGDSDVDIIFVARGENLEKIKQDGLKLETAKGIQIARPAVAAPAAELSIKIDVLVCCVKTYDLDECLTSLEKNIASSTVILPFLNGVNASDHIRQVCPQARVWDGCAYIVSRLTAPGHVTVAGTLCQFFIAADREDAASLKRILSVFRTADIDIQIADDVGQVLWTKFLFISSFATLTSAFDLCIGEILERPSHRKQLGKLMTEINNVAKAKGVSLMPDINAISLAKMQSLPFRATSSMHSDFKSNKRTEFAALTDYVIDQGLEMNIATPLYHEMKTLIHKRWYNR